MTTDQKDRMTDATTTPVPRGTSPTGWIPPIARHVQEIDIVCSAGGGSPYEGGHHLLVHHFTMIEPGGEVKRFCDSDCVREHYRFLWHQFTEQLDREFAERLLAEPEAFWATRQRAEAAEPEAPAEPDAWDDDDDDQDAVDTSRWEAEHRRNGYPVGRWEDGRVVVDVPPPPPPPPPPALPPPAPVAPATPARTLRFATGTPDVPEGLFFQEEPGLSFEEWQARAHAAGARSWRVIGSWPANLGHRARGGVIHTFRIRPRGSGRMRRLWSETTECGQIVEQPGRWVRGRGVLAQTTCLVCRTVVRERHERDRTTDLADLLLDEYEWQEQEAAYHREQEARLATDPAEPR